MILKKTRRDYPICYPQVPGIGPVQQAYLSALDIHKISDIITHRGTLAHLFTEGTVHFYLNRALGLGSNQVLQLLHCLFTHVLCVEHSSNGYT